MLIQKQGKQLITQIIMRRYIFPAALLRVAIGEMPYFEQLISQRCQTAFHAVEQIAIAHQDLYNPAQIIRLPILVHIRLGRAYRAAQSDLTVETHVQHIDSGT